MKLSHFHKIIFSFCFLLLGDAVLAQQPVIRLPAGMRRPTIPSDTAGRSAANSGRKDTTVSNVERRDYSDDSLQVQVYFLGTVKPLPFDTSIRDFTLRFPIPATHLYLGNDGGATKSFLFGTPQRIGFDPGFHSYDVYKWRLDNVRFYSTPKPYTELGYVLGGGQEQIIEVLHTQNIKPYWNVNFQYRLLSAPGVFRNQKNYHSNYQIASWYQSPGKRYNNYFVVLGNKIGGGQNGGIVGGRDVLDDPIQQRNRITIPTNIGGDAGLQLRPFSSVINTAFKEKESIVFLRQQYDLGRKDSIVTDSTVVPLFYPRLRFEHSLRYGKYTYWFQDVPVSGNAPDSTYYAKNYGIKMQTGDSVFLQDAWQEVSNDFSIYQFPDANNLQQYIKLGAELQLLKGQTKTAKPSLYNIIAHGEYRNRTKNQKWDINAFGRLYTAGFNSGDYHAFLSLQRLLSQQLGTLQVGGENINRSPSFIYDQRSSFYLDTAKTFTKENTFHFFGRYFMPKLNIQLNGDYYFINNYLYLNGYKTLQQENAVFNLLRVSALKTFRLNRRWNIHSEVYVQQKAGGAEINLPLIYTRNRIAYEGRFFTNLNLSTGLEIRYNTPYKADNFSPVLGQFFYQDSVTISNRPDVHLFLHLRIRTFKAYLRVENLNTIAASGFNYNNFAAPHYPLPGMYIRFGIYWTFIN